MLLVQSYFYFFRNSDPFHNKSALANSSTVTLPSINLQTFVSMFQNDQNDHVHVLLLFYTYWTYFPPSWGCRASSLWTQEVFFCPHVVTGGGGPCIRQFHTLCSKHMSHQNAFFPSNSGTVQVSSPSPNSFYFLFPRTHQIFHSGCTLYRDAFLAHFQHWTNHA